MASSSPNLLLAAQSQVAMLSHDPNVNEQGMNKTRDTEDHGYRTRSLGNSISRVKYGMKSEVRRLLMGRERMKERGDNEGACGCEGVRVRVCVRVSEEASSSGSSTSARKSMCVGCTQTQAHRLT